MIPQKHLELAIKLDPENVSSLLNLSAYYAQTNDMTKAMDLLHRAELIEPHNRVVQACISNLYLQQGNTKVDILLIVSNSS